MASLFPTRHAASLAPAPKPAPGPEVALDKRLSAVAESEEAGAGWARGLQHLAEWVQVSICVCCLGSGDGGVDNHDD